MFLILTTLSSTYTKKTLQQTNQASAGYLLTGPICEGIKKVILCSTE